MSERLDEIWSEAKYKLVQIYFHLGDLRQALALALELERKAAGYRDVHRLKLQIQEAAGHLQEFAQVSADSKAPERTSPRRKARKLG